MNTALIGAGYPSTVSLELVLSKKFDKDSNFIQLDDLCSSKLVTEISTTRQFLNLFSSIQQRTVSMLGIDQTFDILA